MLTQETALELKNEAAAAIDSTKVASALSPIHATASKIRRVFHQ